MNHKITHDELTNLGFHLNFPTNPQSFYSLEIDDETKLYFKNNKVSLFKRLVGNVHQFKNIQTLSELKNIIKIFTV